MDLSRLDCQIRERLQAAEALQQQQQRLREHQLAERQERSRRFGAIADRLVDTIIQLRMVQLASYFGNAEVPLQGESSRYHCVCRFQHCGQFPVTSRLDLGVSHDANFEQLLVFFDLEILPVPFRFNGKKQMAVPLDAVDEEAVAAWIEDRIVSFVDTYLGLECPELDGADWTILAPIPSKRGDAKWNNNLYETPHGSL